MDTYIVFVYCLCDDLLKGLRHWEDPQCEAGDAEILTTALVAARYFGGNFAQARDMLFEQRYFARRLCPSRFNRRLHRRPPLLEPLFGVLAGLGHAPNPESLYGVDSFPVAACDNYRICRCRRHRGEAWRGYPASKRRYFHGVKIHRVVAASGQPVEFVLAPGADADVAVLKRLRLDLPENSTLTGARAYNDYAYEDVPKEAGLNLIPLRKLKSTRPLEPALAYLMATARKAVETTGSLIERLLPKHIHSVTARGFELKLGCFVVACAIGFVA